MTRLFSLVTPYLVLCFLANLSNAEPLKLEKGDHIAILGNTLADRMQHFGYLEGMLHRKHPNHELVFRNLGFSGDEVNTWHRSQDFGTQDEWLTKTKADVIFAFYGFNESFHGDEGLDTFKSDLDRWLKEKAAKNYSGKGEPQIVLFSPIAVEDTGDKNHPDPEPLNSQLAPYVAAMKEVAESNSVCFVDLFALSQELYEGFDQPLTINGLHLHELGYRMMNTQMYRGLYQATPGTPPDDIRNAIIDKNTVWFSRYRTVDGYNVYGGRSKKVYEGISNFQVMQEEMSQRDVMTANRDQRIWAIAKGGDLEVKDDNLPKITEVPTNLPPQRIAPYPDPEEAIAKMQVHSGMKVNLFASEKEFPELANPVQMAWDTRNRLWVAAWPTYPEATPTDKVMDKLLVFEDTDWDGKADKMTTFADGLNSPTGFQFYRDGVLVMQAPDVWFLRDTDGDGKADWKERVLNGICSADSHHTTNAMCYDPGGGIYLSDGVFHRTQVETAHGVVRNSDGSIYRFFPRTGDFDWYMAHRFANPHGKVFDKWGNDYITDATGNHTYFGGAASGYTDNGRKHASIKEFWARPSRPCPATDILSSAHFPDEFQGNFINGNVISFQGTYRVGVDWKKDAAGPWGETLEHLVFSDPAENQHFRPICMSNGPDGALYFCDWSQTIIGHLQHHIRDPERDHQHGRIYRITYEGRELAEPPKIHGSPVWILVQLLTSPVNGTRLLAKIELDTHPTEEVITALEKAWQNMAKFKYSDPEHFKMELLWVHQWHNVVNEALLKELLASPKAEARAAAGRVLCYWRDEIDGAMDLMRALCDDPHPRVRLEGVRMASFYQEEDALPATEAALLALKHETDYYLDYIVEETMKQLEPWWREAISEGESIAEDNPAGIAYLMKSVDNKALLNMPKIPIVLTAWLTRPGIAEMKRLEALVGLSEAKGTTAAEELVAILESDTARENGVGRDLGRILTRQLPAELKPLRNRIAKLQVDAEAPAPIRRAATAAVILADGSIDDAWANAAGDIPKLSDLFGAIPLINDPEIRATAYENVQPFAAGIPDDIAAKLPETGGTNGRYIRVSLPRKGTLTLAEVEVMSEGRNIAGSGKASQSTEGAGGKPERAIDGNTSGNYGHNSSTHTSENKNNPWWELDLGSARSIESVSLWNRTDGTLGNRLEGFTLEILDGSRQPVFSSADNAAPAPNVTIETGGDPAGDLRRAAIQALVSTRQEPKGTFALLTELIRNGDQRNAACRVIRKIPRDAWDKGAAGQTALALLDWAKEVPAEQRTGQDFIENVQVAREMSAFLGTSEANRVRGELADLGVAVFVVRTLHEQLRYDTTRIVVEAGKPFEIIFENDDTIPHNLLVSEPGSHLELGNAAMTMPPDKLDKQGRPYIPETTRKIFGATKLLEAGDRETLQLTAPKKLGEYEYVCTFPGHAILMWGRLIVTDDVEAYLMENPTPKPLQ